MNKVILHSNLIELFLLCRSSGIDPSSSAVEFLNFIYNNIASNISISDFTIFIPAFDYSPFRTKKFNSHYSNTDFGLARYILDNLPKSFYDYHIDPIFSYLSYPGTGNILNKDVVSFMPFQDKSNYLLPSDYLLFSKTSFQPSHLMELEYRFFGESIPYRYPKTFSFSNENSIDCDFRYNVRPLDSNLCTYDLDILREKLLSSSILDISCGVIEFCNYGQLSTMIFDSLAIDPLFLLSSSSKEAFISISESYSQLPARFFY